MITADFEFTPSSFNLTVNDQDFRSKAENIVREIIETQFSGNYEKSRVIARDERLNFACPYCGDSVKDNHKKRGNIYLNTFEIFM